MALPKDDIEVQVGMGLIRVAADVYPLRQVARVATRRLDIDQWKAWKEFIQASFGMIVLGLLIACWDRNIGTAVGIAGVLIMALVHLSDLLKPPVFGLILTTSGTDLAAVWSTDEDEIAALADAVTAALTDPDRPVNVFNIHNHVEDGDVNQVFGDIAGGKPKVGGR
ncbi:DUF6232 family protein [Glycomyces sp. NPDC021274]|uniref:DUF6232 family protein n=1 Tax=Glycomyces sp. NPDC021274 TaxID=3155120 RepID=UPI0033E2B608